MKCDLTPAGLLLGEAIRTLGHVPVGEVGLERRRVPDLCMDMCGDTCADMCLDVFADTCLRTLDAYVNRHVRPVCVDM